jgi:dTDP-4-dehydrorhamnose 3,5-epimerase
LLTLLEGIKIYEWKKIPDERGFFAELLRQDWKELLGNEWVVQANLSFSYPGIIRAWHRHLRGQTDYFIVLQGAMKICAYDQTIGQLDEIIVSEDKPEVVKMPGHYWHGTKTIGNGPSLTLYFTTRLYDYENPDEERRFWNDQSIIDPKTQKPYDWNKPPHK